MFYSLEFANTGTDAIRDQPLLILVEDGARIVDYLTSTCPSVGFGNIDQSSWHGNSLELKVALFNPNDRLVIEIVSLDNSTSEIRVVMKNADVVTKVNRKPLIGSENSRNSLPPRDLQS